MKNLLTKHYRNIDQLPLIARSAILASALILIFMIWYNSFWDNLYQNVTTTTRNINSLESSITNLKAQLETLKKNIKVKEELLNNKENTLVSNSTELLSSHQTSKVLYDLLINNNKLNLLQLKNTPPKEVLLPKSNLKVFEHGVMIKFSGDYFSTMNYLQAIEKLPWKIFWDKLEYKVTQYPTAEITLYIHTVSIEDNWIHV